MGWRRAVVHVDEDGIGRVGAADFECVHDVQVRLAGLERALRVHLQEDAGIVRVGGSDPTPDGSDSLRLPEAAVGAAEGAEIGLDARWKADFRGTLLRACESRR